MTNRSPSYDDAYQSRMIEPWDGDTPEHVPTPGYFGRTPATLCSPSPAPEPGLQPDQLGFLPFSQWEESADYDEQPPRYLCYTIAWKLVLNRMTVGKVTEEDLVVAPSEYWDESLKADVDDMLRTKKKRHKRVRSEGTAITVSVDDRSQRDLEKFYNFNINWTPVEKQLRKWSNLLRIGKKITVIIALNYRYDDDVDDGPTTSASRRVEKRGRESRTKRMLAEREECINAEEESTGRLPNWNLVYERMRCQVRSCPHKSDWCWEDPRDKKHYKLRAPHLERLIDYVDGGGRLESHEDVPDDVRRDVVLESQMGRKSKKVDNLPATGAPYPPININLMSAETARASTVTPSPPRLPPDGCLHIPGPREQAVRDYCKWLESRVTEEAYKADFRRICQVILENHLDLELIFEEPDSGFFIQQGIKLGTARRFLRDIHEWATTAGPQQGPVEEL